MTAPLAVVRDRPHERGLPCWSAVGLLLVVLWLWVTRLFQRFFDYVTLEVAQPSAPAALKRCQAIRLDAVVAKAAQGMGHLVHLLQHFFEHFNPLLVADGH